MQKIHYWKTTVIYEKLAFLFYCIVISDCTFSGFGHWFRIGNISLRMISGILALLCSMPIFLTNIKSWKKDINFLSLAGFFVMLVYSIFKGIVEENSNQLILLDLRDFFWLILFIVSYSVCNSTKRINIILICILSGGIFQALLVNFIHFFLLFKGDLLPKVISIFDKLGLGFINDVGDRVLRIFLRSNLYLGISFLIIFHIFVQKKGVISKFFLVFIPLILFALFMTFTRSTYFAVFIAIVLFCILVIRHKPAIIKNVFWFLFFAVITVFVYILAIQFFSEKNYLGFALQRTFPTIFNIELLDNITNTENFGFNLLKIDEKVLINNEFHHFTNATTISDNLRKTTKTDLFGLIKRNLIFGNGLGAAIPSREGGRNEYFFLDLLAKTGILGLLFYSLPFIILMFRVVTTSYPNQLLMINLLAGLVLFFIASYFNPYLNSALGISYYSFVIGVEKLQFTKNQKKLEIYV